MAICGPIDAMAKATATGLRLSEASSVVLEEQRDATVGISVSLHPLPIISISEHLTRTAVQTGSSNVKVVGALMGTQAGREVEVHTSFELLLFDDQLTLDRDFLESRQRQFKQVFPSFEILGWYSNGPTPTEADLHIHKQLLEYNESSLFLQLSPSPASLDRARAVGELPICVYETFVEVGQAAAAGTNTSGTSDATGPSIYFCTARYTLETGEAERIAVDHTSKPVESDEEGKSNTLIANLTMQYNAHKMLLDRIQTLNAYIGAVQAGREPRNHELLREISSIVAGLPGKDDLPEYEQERLTEQNDALLTEYLSRLTGNLNTMSDLVDKFDVVQSGNEDTFGGGAAGASRLKGGRGTMRAAKA